MMDFNNFIYFRRLLIWDNIRYHDYLIQNTNVFHRIIVHFKH